jgi:hypothetical protein
MKTQIKRIRPFTIRSLWQTPSSGSLASDTRTRAIKTEGINAAKRSDMATVTENTKAIIVLTLGSIRCIIESPMAKPSSITLIYSLF